MYSVPSFGGLFFIKLVCVCTVTLTQTINSSKLHKRRCCFSFRCHKPLRIESASPSFA